MIDINELRQLAQAATPGPWKMLPVGDGMPRFAIADGDYLSILTIVEEGGCTFGVVYEDSDARYIAAVNPAAISELLDRLDAAEKERDWHVERREDAMNECDALRAAVRHEADCVEAAKAEIDALRAKIERADRLEKVESALSDLLNDLEERAKWNLEASQRVVACGNGVYVRAKAALEESK